MLNPSVFIGEPLYFTNKIKIYPPRVKDVVGNPSYSILFKILTTSTEDLTEELQTETVPSPFEFLLANCYHDKRFSELVQFAFLFFCRADVEFLFESKEILVKSEEGESCIQELDFFDFQNSIREACGEKPLKPPEPINLNEDPRVRRIKELAKQRDRIKAKQQAKKGGTSLGVILTAICCMGIGLTPLNIGEMSYAAIGPIMKMMQDKEKYDLDIRSLLAGADSKKVKPKYWIRNLD